MPSRADPRALLLAAAAAVAAAVIPGGRSAAADTSLAVQDPAEWTAEKAWLGNPADRCEARRGEPGVVFRVEDPGRGMKWRRALSSPFALEPFRHVAIRYRARGAARRGDYLLALLGGPEGGPQGYVTPIPPEAVRADGRWRTASAPIPAAAAAWTLRGLALQVQAGGEAAEIEVAEVRFLAEIPLVPIEEVFPFRPLPGAEAAAGFEPVDLTDLARTDASAHRAEMGLRAWLPVGLIEAEGAPFRVLDGPRQAVATGLEGEGAVAVPLEGRAPEVHLLLLARLEGQEEPAFGSGPLRELRGVDRAAFAIRYRQGPPDSMAGLSFPERRFAIGRSLQAVVLFADPERELEAVEVIDRSRQVDLLVLAVTVRRGPGLHEALRPRPRPGAAAPGASAEPPSRPAPERLALRGNRLECTGPALEATLDIRGLRLEALRDARRSQPFRLAGPSALVRLLAGGRELGAEAWRVRDARVEGVTARFEAEVRAPGADLLVRGEVTLAGEELLWSAAVENRGDAAGLEVRSPDLEGIVARDAATDELFYPKRGAVLTAEPCAYSLPGSGLFPVQFMDISAAEGGGLYVRTEDRSGLDRLHEASKGASGARVAVVYPTTRLERGAVRALARAALGVHAGDWHAAFGAYKRWLVSWHRPRQPLKPWFREVFNFRQRFLWIWDPIYEPETGRFRIAEAIAEAREAFGGLEHLHLMDWGSHPQYGRVYGRAGDRAPWDAWKGGMASFRQALGEARAAGVPVGLYVEGYLLEERGKLGSGPGKAWQIAGAGGQGLYWPGATEMFICPHVKAWRETQAATYRLLAESFAPDGVYIDQLGFADWGKRCWSAAHGHPVPAAPLLGERELTRDVAGALAAAGRPETAVYTEEVPCDIANGFQDGRFTYAMNDALRSPGAVPLNLARFAFPAFKTFEILICDQPTGSWAEGVLWTFFNGEGLWLEGPAFEWFRPRTLEAVRRAHAVLRRHREAFMTLEPEPLVPTLAKEVLANRFPAPRETVYTLLSTLPCTWRGPVLAVPAEEGSRFLDAWNDRPLEPRRREGEGGQGGQGGSPSVWEVAVEIEPYGVGCVVVSRG